VKIRFRHRGQLINGTYQIQPDGSLIINYDQSKAITPGQFAVLYQKKICLGGGIVTEIIK